MKLRYSDHTKPVNTEPPKVDILMIQVRDTTHPWVEAAVQSVADQSYPRLGLIEVDNRDRSLSIGAAWNAAVQASEAELVMPMGDDDILTMDLIASLVDQWQYIREHAPNVVHINSMCTILDEDTGQSVHASVQHTGMFLRQFLLDYPFNETLGRNVGLEKIAAMANAQVELGQPLSMGVRHHYGYIFRQHAFMASGRPMRRA